MATKRYSRRRGPSASRIIRETASAANRLSWRKCLVLGAIGFVMFYWLVPGVVEHRISGQASNPFFPAIEVSLRRTLRFLKLTGVGIALVCVFFAVRNGYTRQRMGHAGLHATGFFARLLARILD
jgi:hypothetical protein